MTAIVVVGPATVRWSALSRPRVALVLLQPYLGLAAVFAVVTAVLVILRKRVPALRGITAALIVAMLLGVGLTRLVPYVRDPIKRISADGGVRYRIGHPGPPIAPGGIAAAHWLRDHSNADDRVATNVHCRDEAAGKCDNRHFWIAAYTERRVLVEGWGYTPSANAHPTVGTVYYTPFWDPEILADNDRAFAAPTAENVQLLRDRYGVRWLFVDERFNRPAAGLDEVARLRYRSGDSAVYEISLS
jgi:hypothetical protein